MLRNVQNLEITLIVRMYLVSLLQELPRSHQGRGDSPIFAHKVWHED